MASKAVRHASQDPNSGRRLPAERKVSSQRSTASHQADEVPPVCNRCSKGTACDHMLAFVVLEPGHPGGALLSQNGPPHKDGALDNAQRDEGHAEPEVA